MSVINFINQYNISKLSSKINSMNSGLKKDVFSSTLKSLLPKEILDARRVFVESIRESKPDLSIFAEINLNKFVETAPEEVFERFKKLAFIKGRKVQFDLEGMRLLAELPKELFEKAKKFIFIKARKDNQLTGREIYNLVHLPEESFSKMKDLLFIKERGESQLSGKTIGQLLSLQESVFEKIKQLLYIKERGAQQFSDTEISGLASVFGKRLNIVNKKPKNIDEFFENLRKLTYIKKLGQNQLDLNECFQYAIFSLISSNLQKVGDVSYKSITDYITQLEGLIQKNRLPEYDDKIKNLIILLRKKIDSTTSPIRVSKEANYAFWKNFLVTADKNNLEVIKSLDKIITSHGKQGIPLKYARADFIRDLNSHLDRLSPDERSKILEKLGITLTEDKKGYNGLLNFDMLSSKNPVELRIKRLCKKFLLENEVITGNPRVDKFLNSIIKGMPEFVNIIGKKQHDKHKYSLDMHILKVLRETVSNPKFATLSDTDKMVAQLMVLFHDIGKMEGVIDKNHEKASAVILNDIFKKVNLPEVLKRRIVELVKNHNWLEQIGMGKISHEQAAVMFRNPGDIKIAEIFAKADLKGVSKEFFEKYNPSLEENLPKISEALQRYYQSGNMIFPTRFLASSRIPTVLHKGVEYKVIDISKLPDDFDLEQIGLSVKRKKDLRLLVHAPENITQFVEFDSLSKPFNESVICATMVTPEHKNLFSRRSLGLIMDTSNSNIINSFYENQGSGRKRDFKTFVDMIFKKPSSDGNLNLNLNFTYDVNNEHRFHQMKVFMKYLSERYKLSETDYAEIYRHLVDKRFLEQIEDITLSSGQVIKKGHLISAYKQIEKFILENSGSMHNEINLYNPSVKGVVFMGESVSEIPEDILHYIHERNLPIILMGKRAVSQDISECQKILKFPKKSVVK